MAKEVIGYVECTSCGYHSAEVKETKRVFQGKNMVMVWCPSPNCLSQHFPRSPEGSRRIRDRMRPIESEAEAENPPAHQITPPSKPSSGGLSAIFG